MISNNSDNPRRLWNCINRTLNRKTSVSLPAHDSTNSHRNSFSKHFKDKITKFMLLSQVLLPVVILIFQLYITRAQFPASLTEVAKLILSSPNKSCELDPILTFPLKSCLHTPIVPITKIINASLRSGLFLFHFKLFLRKPSLPPMI